MIFRRLIVSALLVGLLSGLILSLVQIMAVNPIIFAAETFEVSEPETSVHDHHDHSNGHSHTHSEDAWSPIDGVERTLYTVLSNVLAGFGFSAVLLALMSQLQGQGLTRVNVLKGCIWGVAGFLAFFVAPGVGLPPEIPGVEAAVIGSRQLWWAAAVSGAGAGLLLLFFAPTKFKALGVLAILVPYLMPIPHHDGAVFAHPDTYAVERLTELHQQFILASGITNLIFWLALGAISAWALNRFIYRASRRHEENYA